MKKLSLFLFMVLFAISATFAQRSVSGKVTDEAGEALIGASVLVKGTSSGTVTDLDGNFTVEVPDGNNMLVISYTGYRTQEVDVSGTSTINVALAEEAEIISEVIVTGYRTELKKEVTSAISSVKADEIEGLPVHSFDRAIQGKAAGVQITSGSGAPGGSAEIRIRGVGSINAGNDPLIIVDGVQLNSFGGSSQGSSNPLSGINPNDIESIEVLKDAASTALYGAQGANGVILVTTKGGSRNQNAKFQLSYQEGVVQPYNLYEMMNSQQYAEIRQQAYINNPALNAEQAIELYGDPNDPNLPYEDWIDVLWRDAKFRTADLSFSGGSERVDYFSSFSYNRQESQIITNDWERITGRFNLNADLSDKLSAQLKTSLGWTDQEGQPCDGGNFVNCPFGPSFRSMPVSPALDENGEYNPYPLNGESHNFSFNELQNAENVTRLGRTLQSVSSLALTFEPVTNLTLRGQAGIDFVNNRDINVRPISIPFFRDAWGGQVFNRDRVTTNWTTYLTATYNIPMGEQHDLSVLAGYEFQRQDFVSHDATGRGFAYAEFINLNSAATPFGVAGTSTTNRRMGYFLSGRYDFNDKYIANFTVRRDASSRFGANTRWGTFYSGSLGWRITQEDFFNVGFVDELKLRVSYGITGNSAIGDFAALDEFGTRGQYLGAPGLAPIRLANDLLGWEESAQLNIGMDFAFLNNKIFGTIDVWDKTNSDLLLATQFPAAAGIQNSSLTDNVGKMRNQGLDFELNAVVLNKGGVKVTLGGSLSFLKNEVLELQPDMDTIFSGGFPSLIVGESISFYNLIDFAGVNPANGRNMAYDANGVPTYSPGVDDVKIWDGAIPDYFGGFSASVEFKGLTLSGFVQYQGGHHLFNNDLFSLANVSSNPDNQLVSQLDYWKQPGDVTNVHMPISGGNIDGISQSDFGLIGTTRFYSDGSYAKLKEIKLSYNVPRSALSSIGINSATLFVQGVNMVTWTKFDGIDPEVLTTRQAFTGGSTFAFPQGRQFAGGLTIAF